MGKGHMFYLLGWWDTIQVSCPAEVSKDTILLCDSDSGASTNKVQLCLVL